MQKTSRISSMLPFGKLILGKTGVLPKYGLQVSKWQKRCLASGPAASEKYKDIKEIRDELIKSLGTDSSYTNTPKSKDHLMKFMVKSQSELPVRKMKDSYDAAIIPLSTNRFLRERYTNFLGNLRLGRLMEDVDMFAVWCSCKHVSYPSAAESQTLPYNIVTIQLDHLEVLNSRPEPSSDIRISGHVCWVGKSSLEVIIWLDQNIGGKWERITRALLLMAARNPNNTGAAIVNAVEAETQEEKEMLKGGELRKVNRLKMMKESLVNQAPTEEELHLVHGLFRKTLESGDGFLDKRLLPPKSRWMHDATLNNLVFCHPEYRNLHNKIFGGFLIRQALELSWSISYIYGMHPPKLLHISDISFYNPVDVGSLLKLYSSVTYAEDHFIQVFVYAESYTSATGESKNTTTFHFTYDLGTSCDSLYPVTYLEAMKYIEGRRHFNNYMQFSKQKM